MKKTQENEIKIKLLKCYSKLQTATFYFYFFCLMMIMILCFTPFQPDMNHIRWLIFIYFFKENKVDNQKIHKKIKALLFFSE